MKIKRLSIAKFVAVVTALYFCFVINNTTTNTVKRYLSASELFIRRNFSVSVQIGRQLTSSSIRSSSTTLLLNFRHALSLRADADRFIILAMTDEGFIDMAINFYETSLRAHHINNFLFVGVGERTCEILTSISIPCFHYADDPSAHKASVYGAIAFDRKMRIRTDMMLAALEANYTVLHCDTDVFFFTNPLPHVKVNTIVDSGVTRVGVARGDK